MTQAQEPQPQSITPDSELVVQWLRRRLSEAEMDAAESWAAVQQVARDLAEARAERDALAIQLNDLNSELTALPDKTG